MEQRFNERRSKIRIRNALKNVQVSGFKFHVAELET
jgi:predicted pyridoxine 5'-phosphate oxidase superfamily flavin-nucleotide-binding protein